VLGGGGVVDEAMQNLFLDKRAVWGLIGRSNKRLEVRDSGSSYSGKFKNG